MDQQQASRLLIYAIIVISALVGAVNLIQSWEPLRLMFSLSGNIDFPTWYLTSVIFTVGVGVLMLVAASLVATYKKRGLQLGLVTHVLYVGNALYTIVRGGQLEALVWLTIVLAVVALYFIYRCLTHYPEQLLFS